MLEKIIRIIDEINDRIGKAVSWIVIPLTLLIVIEVIKRRILNNPSIWAFELSIFLFGAHFMLSVAYGLLHKSHVNVTLITDKIFSRKLSVIIDLVLYVFLAIPFIIVILIYGSDYAMKSWALLETSWSVWHPPLYPIKTVIPITAILVLIQMLSEILKKIKFIFTGDEKWIR